MGEGDALTMSHLQTKFEIHKSEEQQQCCLNCCK